MKNSLLLFLLLIGFAACKNSSSDEARKPVSVKTHKIVPEKEEIAPDSIRVTPIRQASFVMELKNQMIYVDPLPRPQAYKDLPEPDIVLITYDNPGQVLSETLRDWISDRTVLIVPESAQLTLSRELAEKTLIMGNGQDTTLFGIDIKTLNGSESGLEYSDYLPASARNSFLLSAADKRVYISGFTENIDEMRAIKELDLAFVRMDIPDSKSLNKKIDAVLKAQPKKVYPYNYRGLFMFSKLARFKKQVETRDPHIAVQVLNWYPDNK